MTCLECAFDVAIVANTVVHSAKVFYLRPPPSFTNLLSDIIPCVCIYIYYVIASKRKARV